MGKIYKSGIEYSGGGGGIPDGGTTGQVLSKASNSDGDVTWRTPSGGSGLAPEMTWDDTDSQMGLANGNNVLSFRDTGDGVNVGITRPGEYLGGGELAKKDYVDTVAPNETAIMGGQSAPMEPTQRVDIESRNRMTKLNIFKQDYGMSIQMQQKPGATIAEALPSKDYVDNAVKPTSKVYDKNSTAAEFEPFVEGYLVEGGTTYTLYKFFYKTDALPNNTSKQYNLSTLLADYTIQNFSRFTGLTSNGFLLNNGRVDNNAQIALVQQASKNNKNFTIRTYADWSAQTATLEVEFYGTKNA